jgi:RNA polymerase sigma-70 factor (ECF subfamily)
MPADRHEERLLDEYLVAAARAGDRGALAALCRRWERRLIAHAWRLVGEAETARDVAQEALCDIAAGVSRLDDAAAFRSWAYRIVTRRAADFVRKRRRERAGLAAFAAEQDDVAHPAESSAEGPAIARAVAGLPDEQRAAIALFYLEDMTVAEIAAALDVPAGTVKTRLMAAREKLKLALGAEKENAHEQA